MESQKPNTTGHKLTPKQEGFCLSYVETGNASESYRLNYSVEKMKPATVNRKAKFELDKGKIRARLTELQEHHQERHKITIDSLTLRLTAAEQLGLSNNNPSAAVSAIMGIAKLHGFITDKQKVEVDANVRLTDTERAAKLAGILSLAEARKKQAEEKHNA